MPDTRQWPPDHNVNIAADVPLNVLESLRRYAVDRCPVGSFLTAVLANDLEQSLARADADNLPRLKAIVSYVYNCLPAPCHGSRDHVAAWVRGTDGQ